MIARARRAAYEALRSVSTGTSDLAHAIVVNRDTLGDERDRALMMTIVTGAQRWQNRLDWLIARAARRDLRKLDAEVLDILRLGLFQLLFLDARPGGRRRGRLGEARARRRQVERRGARQRRAAKPLALAVRTRVARDSGLR